MKQGRTNTMRGHGLRRGDSGVALILALLFIALLTVIVVEFSYETQVEASFATNQGSDLEAYLAAKSAVARGIALLASDLIESEISGEPEFDSMLDPAPWSFGVPFEPLNGAMSRTTITDEYGKINLNALIDMSSGQPEERELLVNAVREFFILRDPDGKESADAIVDAILDWLDYDDGDVARPEGAENDYYNGLENPYPCKNGPMDSVEELLLIKGITTKVFFGDPEKEELPLTEYFTVHGDWQGRVNINTAREEVIAAMMAARSGVPDLALAQQIYDEVRIEPVVHMSQLDKYGLGGGTQRQQQQNLQIPNQQINEDGELLDPTSATSQQAFTVSSNVFRIHGDGMLEDVLVRIEAYVWRTPLNPEQAGLIPSQQADPGAFTEESIPLEPFRILDWKVIR